MAWWDSWGHLLLEAGGAANPMAAMMNDPAAMQARDLNCRFCARADVGEAFQILGQKDDISFYQQRIPGEGAASGYRRWESTAISVNQA